MTDDDEVRQGVEEEEEEEEEESEHTRWQARGRKQQRHRDPPRNLLDSFLQRVCLCVCVCSPRLQSLQQKATEEGRGAPGKLSRSQPNACLSQVTPMAPGVVHISCAPQQHGKPSGQQQLGLSRGCTTFGHQLANACRHPATAWLAANPLGTAIDALDALSVCNMVKLMRLS